MAETGSSERDRRGRRFLIALGAILLVSLLLRVGYIAAQPASDPWHSTPAFDGAYYVSWALGILGQGDVPGGAYYHAPLYPYLLAAFFALCGERFGLLYLLQHLLVCGAAALLALGMRRSFGTPPALLSAALLLLYPPLTFFASRPLGETAGLFLLVSAWAALRRETSARAGAAGALAALAALARPNLLLVVAVWVAGLSLARRWKSAAVMTLCVAAVILPVALRNLAVSGHLVPISSNAGLTLYHGNGPGALHYERAPLGSSANPLRQRGEATALARQRSARELDDVEADRWWGRQALRARLDAPAETLLLALRRTAMLLDRHEYGLDYAPELDENPWRPTLRPGGALELPPVSLALLLGLAVSGLVTLGARKAGGWRTWAALAACAAAPLIFYVSSRYRLPFAALLAIPAGCGLAALLGRLGSASAGRRAVAGLAGGVVLLLSWTMPLGGLARIKNTMKAESLAQRAVAWRQAGEMLAASEDAEAAFELAPNTPRARFNIGVVREAQGRTTEAEADYRLALEMDPHFTEAAGNLSGILIRSGRAAQAVPFLLDGLEADPDSAVCWTNLVVAHFDSGDREAAIHAARRAADRGVRLDPGLLREIGADPGGSE